MSDRKSEAIAAQVAMAQGPFQEFLAIIVWFEEGGTPPVPRTVVGRQAMQMAVEATRWRALKAHVYPIHEIDSMASIEFIEATVCPEGRGHV